MNKLSIVMQFESLPNEMILECFKYLNAFEVYHSFDQLNFRFNKLIRQSPLHLNLQHVRKSIFDQFCNQMLLKPEIKDQIYSLTLSNEGTCGQIKRFLSFFSLNEFYHLQSLTLIHIDENDIDKLKTVLPLIPKLYSLNLFESKSEICLYQKLFAVVGTYTSPPYKVLMSIDKTIFIMNLTLTACPLKFLYQLFKYTPMIKYLTISHHVLRERNNEFNRSINKHYAIHLKQLIINDFKCEFEDFERLVKCTPNLRSLTISMHGIIDATDADRWEYLIKSSLPSLDIFKFIFSWSNENNDNTVEKKFKRFQSNFWQKEHRWYTAYICNESEALICTIPYISKYWFYDNSCDVSMNDLNIFDNVKDLTWCGKLITKQCQYHFPAITSLSLRKSSNQGENDNNLLLEKNLPHSFRMIVNTFHLTHLNVLSYYKIEASMFFDILNKAPQLSSLTIELNQLLVYFNDDKLCKCLNKMIKKLDLINIGLRDIFKTIDDVEQFCKIFSNLEQIKCSFFYPDQLLCLVKELPKLSSIVLYIYDRSYGSYYSMFLEVIDKLNLIFRRSRFRCNDKTENAMVHKIYIWNN